MNRKPLQMPLALKLVKPRKDVTIKYACMVCGRVEEDDLTLCEGCGSMSSFASEETSSELEESAPKRKRARPAPSISRRKFLPISTGRPAWDEALGGGLVKPSTVLVHGPKGTGKTTTMLGLATTLARKLNGYALYGTAEMSDELLRHYAERSNVDIKRLLISDAGDTENLLTDIEEFQPVVVVWDSVQAFSWEGSTGETELRNTIRAAIRSTASYETITLLVSQVTKDNDFLGPSELGHGVDVVIELERKKDVLLVKCPEKNRFAPTPRIGEEDIMR
jgi:DNA repair protein RadA/Sms